MSTRISTSVAGAVVAAALFAPAAGAPPVRISVPPGYGVTTFASGLDDPTAMAWGLDGRLYVTEDTGLLVVAGRGSRAPGGDREWPDDTGPRIVAGRGSRKPVVVARGLRTPLGLAWRRRTLYVSEQGRLSRFVLRGSTLRGRRVVVGGLPFGEHQQDNVVLGPDRRLYLGSGSTCDVCVEKSPQSAAILSLRPDGSDLRIVARGLRNPFGLAFEPGTHRLYASVNGQDHLGTAKRPEPAESIVLVRSGAFYGWPRCWPSYRMRVLAGRCRSVTPPVAYLEPHSSADGIAFWRGDLFVALWGQYLSNRHGRRLVRIDLGPGGRAKAVTTFARGFDHPLALVVDPKGGLLVADWGRGVIYRIQSRGG